MSLGLFDKVARNSSTVGATCGIAVGVCSVWAKPAPTAGYGFDRSQGRERALSEEGTSAIL
jgi:hypothetical protein